MGKLGKRAGALAAFGLMILGTVGCSSLGDTLGFSPPANPLLNDAKAIRDAAPVPAPGGRELAKELLPTHIVEPGDTLLVQPVELDAPVRLPPDQPVQPDGTIDLGVYGRPIVAGRSLPQIEAQIRELIRAHDKGKDFAVTVRLIGRTSKVFYVLGEVNAPGAFPITGRETVLDGIIAAGGVTRKASLGNIVLARPTLPDGCRVVYPVCYQQITQLGDTTTNYQLQPGDRIFVPSRGTLEGLFPKKCQTPTAACSRPQVPCGSGACAPGAPLPGGPPATLGAPPGSIPFGSTSNRYPSYPGVAAPVPYPGGACSGGACPAPMALPPVTSETSFAPTPVPTPAPVLPPAPIDATMPTPPVLPAPPVAPPLPVAPGLPVESLPVVPIAPVAPVGPPGGGGY